MTLDELTQTLRMAAVNENTITAMTNAYNLGFEAGQADEREACAKECEHTALRMGSEWMAQHCAEAIRVRGKHA
jgi:hypothetical protein